MFEDYLTSVRIPSGGDGKPLTVHPAVNGYLQQKKYGTYLMIFDDNSKIFLSNLHKNLGCGCLLESPGRSDSNEHPQHRFL